MIFIAKPRICNTPRRVPILLSLNINWIFPHPIILNSESSHRRRSLPSISSYSLNQSLWGVMWNDMPDSIKHESCSDYVLVEAMYTSPLSLCATLFLVDCIYLVPFLLPISLVMSVFSTFPTSSHQLNGKLQPYLWLSSDSRSPYRIFTLSSTYLSTSYH